VSAWRDRDAVLDWLGTSAGFPDTIVDRIVPATTSADRDAAGAALGVRDEMAVVGEPYRQWVLQDSFVAARPRWELDGALVVPDVAPYQLMKLRLLNGSHSAMAYLGAAAGATTVADVLATGWGEPLVRAFGAEVAPTLPDAGLDAKRYVDDLVARFRNPAMHHLLRQIGSDGSLKIPERWFPALRELRSSGAATPVLELALAGWVAATRPDADHGMTDPGTAALNGCWAISDPQDRVGALLRTVGADDLAEQADLTASVAARLPALRAGSIEP
jgi:fructuronate reductase